MPLLYSLLELVLPTRELIVEIRFRALPVVRPIRRTHIKGLDLVESLGRR